MMSPEEFEIIQGQIREAQLEKLLLEESGKLELFREALARLISALDRIQIQDESFESAFALAKGLVDGYRNKNH